MRRSVDLIEEGENGWNIKPMLNANTVAYPYAL
jgi:hypothetical protein